MMKKLLLISLTVFAVYGCSTDEQTHESAEIEDQVEVVVNPNQKLTMEVDGMVCKMGCGGSIRKELKATGAVSQVEFDFEEERATNTATIYFDDSKIQKDKLIELVSELNDKQFTVGETSQEDFKEVSSNEDEKKSSASKEVKVDAYSSTVEMPNLLEILSGFSL